MYYERRRIIWQVMVKTFLDLPLCNPLLHQRKGLKQNKKIYDENPFMIHFAFSFCTISAADIWSLVELVKIPGGLVVGWLDALISRGRE
jgi:hypothetical protein